MLSGQECLEGLASTGDGLLGLMSHGVTDIARVNTAGIECFGISLVWNPVDWLVPDRTPS